MTQETDVRDLSVQATEKTLSPEALSRTVQQTPPGQMAGSMTDGLMFFVASQADGFEPWGRNSKYRDRQLRDFIVQESLFASALGLVCARNSAFSWKIEGPLEEATAQQELLHGANFGKGWPHMISSISLDLYTQDNGAFMEIIREEDSEESPVLGLASLDAARCYPTGIPEEPVLYYDRLGKWHTMKWYQVVHFQELPATYEGLPGLQYCALTRILNAVKIMRDISIYVSEKIGGRNPKAVTLVQGVTPKQIQEAYDTVQSRNDNAGLLRFSQPMFVASIDPNAKIGFETLELTALPDGFDLKETNQEYINQIALGFMTDYQEFSPLPGGNLGTASQSEILHMKSKGKGPGLFMKLIAQAMNWVVLPETCEFSFDEPDTEADLAEADVKKRRAEERSVRIASNELTPLVARQIAYVAGDLTADELQMLAAEDPNPVGPNVVDETEAVEEGDQPNSERENSSSIEEERSRPSGGSSS